MSVDTLKRAFDLRAYSSEKTTHKLAIDAASLSLDAQDPDNREHLFAVPFTYQVDFSKQTITCPEYDSRDIREVCGYSPEVVSLYEHFLNKESYIKAQAYIWISGPDNFPGSRIGIGVGKLTSETTAVINNYSGLRTTLTEKECLDLAYWISGFSLVGLQRTDSLIQLRDHPIFISCPEYCDPWEWLILTILKDHPLSDFIVSGEADRLYQERLVTATILAKGVTAGIATAKNELEYVYWGAWMETSMMENLGIVLNGQISGCGLLNMDLLAGFTQTLSPWLQFSQEVSTTCSEIVCPKCKWKPTKSQESEVAHGTLTCCPECGYDPSTRT